MGRKKIRLSYICVSIVVMLSMILAISGVLLLNKNQSDRGLDGILSSSSQLTADNMNNYLGGVDEAYILRYESDPNWVSIANANELKAFLKQTSSGSKNYSGKNGYLTASFDFNWDAEWGNSTGNDKPQMAPNSVVMRTVLDGCGETVNFRGSLNTADNGDTWVNEKNADCKGTVVDDSVPGIMASTGLEFHCFGGLTNVLYETGGIKNLTFNIYNTRYFTYYNSSGESNAGEIATVFGGLVGYNRGGEISNVVVSLNSKIGVSNCAGEKHLTNYYASQDNNNGLDNAIYGGVVVGASRGGKIHNTNVKMNNGGNFTCVSQSCWKGTNAGWRWKFAGVCVVGGVVGYAFNNATINNSYIQMNGGTMTASVDKKPKSGLTDTSDQYYATKRAGLVVGVGKGASIKEMMVEGNLNSIWIGGNSNHETTYKSKSIFVADGDVIGSKIYRDATGGTKTDGDMASWDSGYSANDVMYRIKIESGLPLYYDRTTDINEFSKLITYVPQGKILWEVFGEYKFEDLLSSTQTLDLPTNKMVETGLSTGINDEGEIGFYDGNTEVSDQVRNGNALYYTGRKYGMKILVQGKLYDDGIRVKNIGDLTNAMSTFDGHPVKMVCNEESAYINTQEKVVVLASKLKGLDKTLTISKRELAVTTSSYLREVSNIFSGATVKFGPMPNDSRMEYSGLVNGEKMMWQDDGYNNNQTIALNVAGRQMLRPSTNNYVLKQKVSYGNQESWDELGQSYFSAIINPYVLKVGEGVYLNGSAVGSEYKIMNQNYNKPRITFSYRANDHHYIATAIQFVWKHPTPESGVEDNVETISNLSPDTKGLVNLVKDVNSKDSAGRRIAEVRLVSTPVVFTITAQEENGTKLYENEHHYGELVTVVANDKEGKAFVGWRRLNGTYISYDKEYSFKAFDNFTLTAVYNDIPASGVIINKYYSQYGELLRVQITDAVGEDTDYRLQNKLGLEFVGWELEGTEESEEGTINIYKAKFNVIDGKAQTVLVTINNGDPITTLYNDKIKLEANSKYLINGALVQTGKENFEISAITDLSIVKLDEEDEDKTYADNSMIYDVFVSDDTYYINVTFVYGNNTDETPEIEFLYFNNGDITKLVRNGNIYQVTIEFSVQDMECRFGPEAEIATYLHINGNTEIFKDIIIIKEVVA